METIVKALAIKYGHCWSESSLGSSLIIFFFIFFLFSVSW